jgi:hypothetical protein
MQQAQIDQEPYEEQQTFENYSGELDGVCCDNVDFDILRSNRDIHVGNTTDGRDGTEGPQTRKKRLHRFTFQQTEILQGYDPTKDTVIDFKLKILFVRLRVQIYITNTLSLTR